MYQSYVNSADAMYDNIKGGMASEGNQLINQRETMLGLKTSAQGIVNRAEAARTELTNKIGEGIGSFSEAQEFASNTLLGATTLARDVAKGGRKLASTLRSTSQASSSEPSTDTFRVNRVARPGEDAPAELDIADANPAPAAAPDAAAAPAADPGAAAAGDVAEVAEDVVNPAVETAATGIEAGAEGLEVAAGALDASGIGAIAGLVLGGIGLIGMIGGGITQIVGDVQESKEAKAVKAEQAENTSEQQSIANSVRSAAPSAGSFVITSMNGASIDHLPSSMSHF
tara:strand:+ start:3657 stop:4511 length:855 start_codon:yes stop_codon:yes gene_type:complete